jgi:Predicted membrane protein (DUF2142)
VRADPARLRRLGAPVFAGDRRVWRTAALCALPLVLLVCFECARPRDYNTGTDNVELHGYVARAKARQVLCIPGLELPAGTARLRLQVISRTSERPALELRLRLGGHVLRSELPLAARRNRASTAVFSIPQLPARPAATPGTLCLRAGGPVGWGGTALPPPPASDAPTVDGVPLRVRIAVWYLPRFGAQRSYLAQAGSILRRAALFRGGAWGAWSYALMLLALLPALAIVSLRCLALAVAGRPPRRLAATLYLLAALNFACWALITPPFQAPDEPDHFAYTQSIVERGQAPSRNPDAPLRRWSSAETLALEAVDFLTDHRAADSRPPWLSVQERSYTAQAARLDPLANDGGGNETAATHGPIYYAALAPAYALAGSSPFSQLTLMRLASALIAALTVLFTFLLARELAPARVWLAVLAALLVAYQPMYGFISGSVNNDVGVNAAAAALELLLIRMLRRGITVPLGALTGALLLALPSIKGTGLSLYPVAALTFLAVLWRRHSKADLRGWGALAGSAIVVGELAARLLGGVRPVSTDVGTSAIGANASTSAISSNAGAVSGALHHIPDFLSYLWQVFLPRLPFMTRHFPASVYPAFEIFVERGWATFGWYTVSFVHWVYVVILIAMLAVVPLSALAARREWSWVHRHRLELLVLIATPVAVIVGFEAAYYTGGVRHVIGEVGRYAFPAIGPLVVLVVGALHAFGRRRMLAVGVGLLVAMIALSYASQLLTLSSFFA